MSHMVFYLHQYNTKTKDMKRYILYLFAFIAMLFTSSCDISIGYFMIDNIPHSYHTNRSIIPVEGGEFEFYLVDYVYDESMDTKSLPTIHQCYRYRLNIDESIGAESEDCSSECVTISIPENNTGKVRNLTIEVKVAEDYHNDEGKDFGKPCNDINNQFGEWKVAWRGTQDN